MAQGCPPNTDMSERPLTHFMGLSDSVWGHITENSIRIRRIERLLGLDNLTNNERHEITSELKEEAQAKWYKAEQEEATLAKIKADNLRIGRRLPAAPLILFWSDFISLPCVRWSRQVWNILFHNPKSYSKYDTTNSVKGQTNYNEIHV